MRRAGILVLGLTGCIASDPNVAYWQGYAAGSSSPGLAETLARANRPTKVTVTPLVADLHCESQVYVPPVEAWLSDQDGPQGKAIALIEASANEGITNAQILFAARDRAAVCGATDLVAVRFWVYDERLHVSGIAIRSGETDAARGHRAREAP